MYQAIGIVELKSIAKGIEATDAALKSAGVKLVSAHPSCPGKYEIILTGGIADVEAAVDHVKGRFDSRLIDSCVIGRIDPQVVTGMFGTQEGAKTGSVGIIETFSARPPRLPSMNCGCPAAWAVRDWSSLRAMSAM